MARKTHRPLPRLIPAAALSLALAALALVPNPASAEEDPPAAGRDGVTRPAPTAKNGKDGETGKEGKAGVTRPEGKEAPASGGSQSAAPT